MKVNARKIKSFGRRVQAARKARGYTQEQLAETVGISSAYVGFIEQGIRMPSIKTADKLARAVRVKLSDLLD